MQFAKVMNNIIQKDMSTALVSSPRGYCVGWALDFLYYSFPGLCQGALTLIESGPQGVIT